MDGRVRSSCLSTLGAFEAWEVFLGSRLMSLPVRRDAYKGKMKTADLLQLADFKVRSRCRGVRRAMLTFLNL
jgi:hypothetical protein